MTSLNLIAFIISFALHVKALVLVNLSSKTQYVIFIESMLFLGQFLAILYVILKINKITHLHGRRNLRRLILDGLPLWVKIVLSVLLFYASVITSIGTQIRINSGLNLSLRNYWEPRIVSITPVIIYAVTATVAYICQKKKI